MAGYLKCICATLPVISVARLYLGYSFFVCVDLGVLHEESLHIILFAAETAAIRL